MKINNVLERMKAIDDAPGDGYRVHVAAWGDAGYIATAIDSHGDNIISSRRRGTVDAARAEVIASMAELRAEPKRG